MAAAGALSTSPARRSPPATTTADLDLAGLQIVLEELLGAEMEVISGGGFKPDEREEHTAMLAETIPLWASAGADPFGSGGIGEVAAVILETWEEPARPGGAGTSARHLGRFVGFCSQGPLAAPQIEEVPA